MKKHIIKIIKIIMIIISILIIGYVLMWGLIILTFNLEQKKPSEKRMKKEITAYLDKNLDDKYEIKNIIKEDDEETIYSIYIPDDDITVPIKYHDRHDSLFQVNWEVDDIEFEIAYYNIKFIKASNDRKALLKKYPDITEKITYDYHKTPEFNIYVDDIEHIEEIYGYLTDSYKLNNYKLYTDIEYADNDDSNNNDKKGNRYFDDYSIEVHIFVDNKEVLNMQYSDIRENFECKQEELYNFISKEKLIEQIKDNYNDVTAYGSAVIQWKK